MALYRNIAGTGAQVGLARDYFTAYGDEGGGYMQPVESRVPYEPVDIVFYDPGFYSPGPGVVSDQPVTDTPTYTTAATSGPYPDPATVYQVQQYEPVTPIETLAPTPSPDAPAPVEQLTPSMPVTTSVPVVNERDTNLFPLLTLAFLYANMVKGERFLGANQGIAFIGGLGLLYYQFNKRAAKAAL